jgi:hypothetical protein
MAFSFHIQLNIEHVHRIAYKRDVMKGESPATGRSFQSRAAPQLKISKIQSRNFETDRQNDLFLRPFLVAQTHSYAPLWQNIDVARLIFFDSWHFTLLIALFTDEHRLDAALRGNLLGVIRQVPKTQGTVDWSPSHPSLSSLLTPPLSRFTLPSLQLTVPFRPRLHPVSVNDEGERGPYLQLQRLNSPSGRSWSGVPGWFGRQARARCTRQVQTLMLPRRRESVFYCFLGGGGDF